MPKPDDAASTAAATPRASEPGPSSTRSHAPVSNLVFDQQGHKLLARVAPNRIAIYPVPNSPNDKPGRIRFAETPPQDGSIVAAGRVRRSVLTVNVISDGTRDRRSSLWWIRDRTYGHLPHRRRAGRRRDRPSEPRSPQPGNDGTLHVHLPTCQLTYRGTRRVRRRRRRPLAAMETDRTRCRPRPRQPTAGWRIRCRQRRVVVSRRTRLRRVRGPGVDRSTVAAPPPDRRHSRRRTHARRARGERRTRSAVLLDRGDPRRRHARPEADRCAPHRVRSHRRPFVAARRPTARDLTPMTIIRAPILRGVREVQALLFAGQMATDDALAHWEEGTALMQMGGGELLLRFARSRPVRCDVGRAMPLVDDGGRLVALPLAPEQLEDAPPGSVVHLEHGRLVVEQPVTTARSGPASRPLGLATRIARRRDRHPSSAAECTPAGGSRTSARRRTDHVRLENDASAHAKLPPGATNARSDGSGAAATSLRRPTPAAPGRGSLKPCRRCRRSSIASRGDVTRGISTS